MPIESRQIFATVEIEIIETIIEMAEGEKRSFSNMIAILLEEAIKFRLELANNGQKVIA